MARAVAEVRTRSMAPDAPELRPSQKAKLLDAIGKAYRALYPIMSHDGERRELHYALNSMGHLAQVWAGDLPRGGVAFDASEFVRAFELNLESMKVVDGIAERAKAMTAKRTEFISSLLSPAADGSGTVQ